MGTKENLALSIFAGAFVFGIVMSSLGALLPALSASAGVEKADAGRLFLAMNFSMLLSSLLFGPISDRFGFRALLLVSTLLIAGSFALLSIAADYDRIAASLMALGFGGGALNGGTNALLNDISPERRARALNLLGIFFGLGAVFTPFFIGSLLELAGLKTILLCLMILTLAPFALFSAVRFPAPKHSEGFSWGAATRMFRSPLLFLFGLLLLFQSGNEFTVGGWVSTYLQESHGFKPSSAAYALAVYWTCVMLGRLAVSRYAEKTSPASLVIGSALTALIGTAGMILSPNGILAAVSVAFVGLGFAAIFPTTLAQAGAAFARFSGTAFSVIFVMALAGGMTAPLAVGRIAQHSGIGNGFWITAASCGAIAFLQGAIARLRK